MKKLLVAALVLMLLMSTACANLPGFGQTSDSPEDWKYGTRFGTIAIEGYLGKSTKLVIPDRLENKKVEIIWDYAFYSMEIESVKVSEYVISVGDMAFAYCENLKTVDLANVEDISPSAFSNCPNLTTVTMSDELYQDLLDSDELSSMFDESPNVTVNGNPVH